MRSASAGFLPVVYCLYSKRFLDELPQNRLVLRLQLLELTGQQD